MSQEAYELLLEANDLFSQDKRDEAISAYREVLLLDPSPNQRQVAEHQLQELGVIALPTLSSSGAASRKFSPNGKGRRASERGRKKPKKRPKRQRARNSQECNQDVGGRSKAVLASQGNGQAGKLLGLKKKSGQRPSKRAEAPTPILQPSSASSGSSGSSHVAEPPPKQLVRRQSKSGPKKVEKARANGQTSVEESAKPIHREKVTSSPGNPQLPKRRSHEDEDAYKVRCAQYKIWLKQNEVYPGIDWNTALRLEDLGWSLEQLREHQGNRRKRYLGRRKEFAEKRVALSRSFSGTKYIDSLVEERVEIWCLGAALEWVGQLTKNELYHWKVRRDNNVTERVHKLQLDCACELVLRPQVWELSRFDQEQYVKQEVASEVPGERLLVPDETLHTSLTEEKPIALELMCGLNLLGWVYWYDPYQLGLVLNVDASESDDLVEVMVFRHSIKAIHSELPVGWRELPTFASARSQKAQVRMIEERSTAH